MGFKLAFLGAFHLCGIAEFTALIVFVVEGIRCRGTNHLGL